VIPLASFQRVLNSVIVLQSFPPDGFLYRVAYTGFLVRNSSPVRANLVAYPPWLAIASLGDGAWQSLHFEAALSMLPTIIPESSITSIQCLILFSIYFAPRVQPRQSDDYIQTVSLRIQPPIKV
jgi:hypothetical protein